MKVIIPQKQLECIEVEFELDKYTVSQGQVKIIIEVENFDQVMSAFYFLRGRPPKKQVAKRERE